MHITAIAASCNLSSINKEFLTSISRYYKEVDDVIEIVDLQDFETSPFSNNGALSDIIPQKVHEFIEKIAKADFVLISFAEDEGNYLLLYKRICDWVSGFYALPIFDGKPVFILATSDQEKDSQDLLADVHEQLSKDGADVLESFYLPDFSKNFETGKGVVQVLYRSRLESKVRKTKRILKQRIEQ